MVADGDTILVFSASGETEELLRVLPAIARFQVQIIAVCGDVNSTLAQNMTSSDEYRAEACPQISRRFSTTVARLGDAAMVCSGADFERICRFIGPE
jgi:arabinose-5-phosphate isomerase